MERNRNFLKTCAENVGADVYLHEAFETSNGFEHIGIRLKNKHVVYWFFGQPGEYMCFDHCYSMNTGQTKRAYSNALRILRAIKAI